MNANLRIQADAPANKVLVGGRVLLHVLPDVLHAHLRSPACPITGSPPGGLTRLSQA